jgi:hypothetical protein
VTDQPSLSPRIDPELRRQLDAAAAAPHPHPVAAVVRLRPQGGGQATLGPEQTQALTTGLLKRVEQRTGLRPQAVNVFRQLDSFVVVAAPAFLTELLSQPEVHGAMANRQPDDPTAPGWSAGAEGDE